MKRKCAYAVAVTLLFMLAFVFGAHPFIDAQISSQQGTVPPPPDSNGWLLQAVVKVVSGDYHSCALTDEGRVKCWGDTSSLGDGSTGDGRGLPLDARLPPEGARDLSANGRHTCIVTNSGGAYCWGINDDGQLGDGTTSPNGFPAHVTGLETGVLSISAGDAHSCAVLVSGAVKCWGKNDSGQLGDGTTTNRLTPVEVAGLTDAIVVAAGKFHTCAIRNGGGVVCWGRNPYGQLGDGTIVDRLTPVAVAGLASAVTTITLGGHFTCAIDINGGAWCWGGNFTGTLGDGTGADRASPVHVVGLDTGVLDIDAGDYHVCAVTAAGGVQCWGSNDRQVTGIDIPGPYPPLTQCSDSGLVPQEVEGGYPAWYFCFPHDVYGLTSGMTSLGVGLYRTSARAEAGTVKCWGRGELGTVPDSQYWRPADVIGAESFNYLTIMGD